MPVKICFDSCTCISPFLNLSSIGQERSSFVVSNCCTSHLAGAARSPLLVFAFPVHLLVLQPKTSRAQRPILRMSYIHFGQPTGTHPWVTRPTISPFDWLAVKTSRLQEKRQGDLVLPPVETTVHNGQSFPLQPVSSSQLTSSTLPSFFLFALGSLPKKSFVVLSTLHSLISYSLSHSLLLES